MSAKPVLPLLLFGLLAGCHRANPPSTPPAAGVANLEVSSTAFGDGQPIPAVYTCDGAETSPPLRWTAGPKGTAVYALILDDPDAPAGTWTHWLLWNIPGTDLAAGLTPEEASAAGIQSGLNSWRKPGYGGPCPPAGEHRYRFRVYALREKLDLPSGAAREVVEAAMEGKVLAEGQLIGTYAKRG